MLPVKSFNTFLSLAVIFSGATLTSAETGQWTVGNCINAQFSLSLTVHDVGNFTDLNVTRLDIKVPPEEAEEDSAQSNCGANKQFLHISWRDKSANGTDLNRNFSIVFVRNNGTGSQNDYYGIERMYGFVELARFRQKLKNDQIVDAMSYLGIDTGLFKPLYSQVPLNHSYFCSVPSTLNMITKLHFTYNQNPDSSIQIPNGTDATLAEIHLEAFRAPGAPLFQTPVDCAYNPVDVVPIVVGVILAIIVVFALVSYMFGRRKRRENGYATV